MLLDTESNIEKWAEIKFSQWPLEEQERFLIELTIFTELYFKCFNNDKSLLTLIAANKPSWFGKDGTYQSLCKKQTSFRRCYMKVREYLTNDNNYIVHNKVYEDCIDGVEYLYSFKEQQPMAKWIQNFNLPNYGTVNFKNSRMIRFLNWMLSDATENNYNCSVVTEFIDTLCNYDISYHKSDGNPLEIDIIEISPEFTKAKFCEKYLSHITVSNVIEEPELVSEIENESEVKQKTKKPYVKLPLSHLAFIQHVLYPLYGSPNVIYDAIKLGYYPLYSKYSKLISIGKICSIGVHETGTYDVKYLKCDIIEAQIFTIILLIHDKLKQSQQKFELHSIKAYLEHKLTEKAFTILLEMINQNKKIIEKLIDKINLKDSIDG